VSIGVINGKDGRITNSINVRFTEIIIII